MLRHGASWPSRLPMHESSGHTVSAGTWTRFWSCPSCARSRLQPDALSHTGAIGLMQFIKGTGAKVSALLDEPLFSPQTLYNPSINLRYSVYYLRLLDDRFNGHFPMAVASYNGGPHHMSRAHRSTLGRLELDAFVEMIPRREPRDYVKKVVSYYREYVSLYGPEGADVVLPGRLRTDDTEVVNF